VDPAFIKEFLVNYALWSDKPRKPEAIYCPTKDMPRKGRVEELRTIWRGVYRELADGQSRPPFMYFHSSPGVGKTFLLRELAMKRVEGIPENISDFARNSLFLSISFDGLMDISFDSNLYDSFPEPAKSNFVILWRILFTMFTTECTWEKFVNDIVKVYNGTFYELKTWLRNQLNAQYADCKKILLIDEIIRLHNHTPGWAEYCRKVITTETKNPESRLFDICITSTLSVELLQGVESSFAASDSRFIPVVNLPMLTMEESRQLFLHYIKDELSLKVWDGEKNQMLGRQTMDGQEFDGQELIARMLAELSGGHGRSIEFLVERLSSLDHKLTGIKCLTYQAMQNASVADYGVDWNVVRAVLSQREVTLEHTVPGTKYSFDYLVRNGSIINSPPTNEKFVPFIPEMFLHYWAHKELKETTESASRSAAGCLQYALATRWEFTPTSIQQTLLHRERAMRYVPHISSDRNKCRVKQTLEELYNGCISDKMSENIKRQKLNTSSTPLFRVCNDDIFSLEDGFYAPNSDRSAYFDYLEISSVSRSKRLYIFHQVKYSETDASTPLDLSTIQNCYDGCKNLMRNSEEFVVIIHGWRNECNNVNSGNLPPNCIVFDREALKKRLGPSFANLVEWQGITPQFVSK